MRSIDADSLKKNGFVVPKTFKRGDVYLEVKAEDMATETAHVRRFFINDEIIDAIPTIEAAPRWIPCSKRLPETNGRYLVTRGLNACGSLWNRTYIINYSDLMGLKKEKIWWDGNVGKSDFEQIDDILAWMPLPKPYKADEVEG